MSPEALRSSIGGMVGGICFLVVGVLMVKTGNPGLIHSYHIAHIPSEKIPLVARLVGLGIALTGAGLLLAGIIAFASQIPLSASAAFILPLIIIFAGLGVSLLTIVVFTFRPWSSWISYCMKLQAHAQQTMKKFTALVGRLFYFSAVRLPCAAY